MIISKKIGRIELIEHQNKLVDFVDFEWYESNKRIAHKTSQNGFALRIKFLNENPDFKEGDILLEMFESLLVVRILPCDCIVISPKNMQELAAVCYEIGNQHIPLFMEGEDLMMAFEKPLFQYLSAMNYSVRKENRKLLHALKTTVVPHGDNKSLFTKIMQLTQSAS
jgi:urease accessory protein